MKKETLNTPIQRKLSLDTLLNSEQVDAEVKKNQTEKCLNDPTKTKLEGIEDKQAVGEAVNEEPQL